MVNKELKKLSRRELVDVIYQMKKNEEEMQQQIASLESALQDKRIKIESAGSIADAATNISNVFSVAQAAADLYLDEITQMRSEATDECAKMIEDAQARVKEVLSDGEAQLNSLMERYRVEYEKWQALKQENEEQKKISDIKEGDGNER